MGKEESGNCKVKGGLEIKRGAAGSERSRAGTRT